MTLTCRLLQPPADLAPWLAAAMTVRLEADGALERVNRFPALVGSTLCVVLAGDLAWPPVPGAPRRPLPRSFLTGPSTAPLVSTRRGRLHCISVSIRPAAVSLLIGEGATAVTDRVPALQDVWGPGWLAWEDAIHSECTEAARLQRLFACLRQRIAQATGRRRPSGSQRPARMEQLVRQLSLPAAAREMALSERQFERVFSGSLGMGPKLYQRITRVEAVLRDALATGRHDADLALRHGYYDQAHLARDFRTLAGAPLTTLLAEARRVGSEHWPLQLGAQPALPLQVLL